MKDVSRIRGIYLGSVNHFPRYTEVLVSVLSCVVYLPERKVWRFSNPPVVRIRIDNTQDSLSSNEVMNTPQGAIISVSVAPDEDAFIARDFNIGTRKTKTLNRFMEDVFKVD